MNETRVLIENYKYTKNATFSKLYLDGVFVCYLLQDTLRPFGIKVHGETGIPEGKGTLVLGNSPKFGRVPFLYNQDDGITYESEGKSFKYLRIHGGNFIDQSDGCPMTGTTVDFKTERTYSSQIALKKFINLLEDGVEYPFEVINLPQED